MVILKKLDVYLQLLSLPVTKVVVVQNIQVLEMYILNSLDGLDLKYNLKVNPKHISFLLNFNLYLII